MGLRNGISWKIRQNNFRIGNLIGWRGLETARQAVAIAKAIQGERKKYDNKDSVTIFKRLCLVPGLSPFEPRVNYPYAPTAPPLTHRLFLDLRAIFFPSGPSFFLVSTIRQVIWPSPGTLLGRIDTTLSRR